MSADHPDVVARLQALLAGARSELGDAVHGVEGSARRPVGRVAEPRKLGSFDPDHPYYMAEYDLADRG